MTVEQLNMPHKTKSDMFSLSASSNFSPPPTMPLPSYIPSQFLFPSKITFTVPTEDLLPGDYSVIHRKLMKQEPPANSWWLQPPLFPRHLLTVYSVSPPARADDKPTVSTEGWHPDY